ncbi:MAG: ABC transporter permease [Chloroflexi bacterium]|nr:ABC transporter permease [Chloroflexota bacterium]MBP8054357.1 ABC transporter permease [Chloroflexota bacterium]
MIDDIKALVAAHELLYTWVRREFKVRYSQSLLGAIWAIMQPLSLMVIFSLVFSLILKIPTGEIPYPPFAYVGLLTWTLFSSALGFAIPSLVNNINLVSKIRFPREILPLSAILVSLIDFAIAALVFVPMLLLYRIRISPLVLFIPVVLLLQIWFTFGLALLASAANVFFRDIRFVIPLALQIWFYLCPIIYPAELIPEAWRPLYFLNPMAVFIDSYRRLLFFHTWPDWGYLGVATVLATGLVMVSYRYFKQAEREFADVI